jgi:hypothetical protein
VPDRWPLPTNLPGAANLKVRIGPPMPLSNRHPGSGHTTSCGPSVSGAVRTTSGKVAASENAVMTHRYQLISSVILAFLFRRELQVSFRDKQPNARARPAVTLQRSGAGAAIAPVAKRRRSPATRSSSYSPRGAYMDFHRMPDNRGGATLRNGLANPEGGREC